MWRRGCSQGGGGGGGDNQYHIGIGDSRNKNEKLLLESGESQAREWVFRESGGGRVFIAGR